MIVSCEHCGKRLEVRDSMTGSTVNCPSCKQAFAVPPSSTASGEGIRVSSGLGGSARAWLGQIDMQGASGAKLVVGIGLVLAIFARGCDNLSNRAVKRAEGWVAEAQQESEQQQRRINEQILQLQGELLEAPADQSGDMQQQIDKLKKQRDEIEERWEEIITERRDDVVSAKVHAQTRGYWYEIAFLLGSMVLVVGLLLLGARGEKFERLIALVMIAIITFSVYVAGVAWIGSIVRSAA